MSDGADNDASPGVVDELAEVLRSLEQSGFEPPAPAQRRPARPLARPAALTARRSVPPAARRAAEAIVPAGCAPRGGGPRAPRGGAAAFVAAAGPTAADAGGPGRAVPQSAPGLIPVPPQPAAVSMADATLDSSASASFHWAAPAANMAVPPAPGVPAVGRAWATIVAPDGATHTLYEGEALLIGRSPGPGGIVVDNPDVSRAHVRVEVRLGGVSATELGTTNGTTLLRGSAVYELVRNTPTPLRAGDHLAVGGTTLLCTVADEGAGT